VNNVFADNTEIAIGNQAAYLDIIDNDAWSRSPGYVGKWRPLAQRDSELWHSPSRFEPSDTP
jgi:hypothetical protein